MAQLNGRVASFIAREWKDARVERCSSAGHPVLKCGKVLTEGCFFPDVARGAPPGAKGAASRGPRSDQSDGAATSGRRRDACRTHAPPRHARTNTGSLQAMYQQR